MKTAHGRVAWFEKVPAYPLIFFRSAIAVLSFFYFIPKLSNALYLYLASSFHSPMLAGIPALPPHTGTLMILTLQAAALCLFAGFLPRLSAAILASGGLYIFLLDVRNYQHWIQFHILLLAILSVTKLPPLSCLFKKKDPEPVVEAWPEYLVLYQLSIVFFYGALEKVFSPFWGLSGTFFLYELDPSQIAGAGGLALLQKELFQTGFTHPAAASLAVIVIEFFIALTLLFRSLRLAAAAAGFLFCLLLEFLIKPSLFPWDAAACFLLLLFAKSRKTTAAFGTLIFIGLAALRFTKFLWH